MQLRYAIHLTSARVGSRRTALSATLARPGSFRSRREVARRAREDKEVRRLTTIPGVGPVIATALAALAPPADAFRRGRDFAAWVGLTPSQHSSGGKQKLGATSKMGERTLRRLLIIGASSVVRKAILNGDEYRQRWGLRSDHPLTAPAYSEQRSTLAKELGLGRKSTTEVAPAPATAELVAANIEEQVQTRPKPRRTRRSRSKSNVNEAAAEPKARQRRLRSRVARAQSEPPSTSTTGV